MEELHNFIAIIGAYLIMCGLIANLYWLTKWLASRPAKPKTAKEISESQQRVLNSAKSLCRVGYQNAKGPTLDVSEVSILLYAEYSRSKQVKE